jgi:hydrogenase maturation factor
LCIARVGKATSVKDGKGSVEFFDGRTLEGVDVKLVKARVGDYVEVFANVALSVLSTGEARRRREAWEEVREAAMVGYPERRK